MKFKYPLQKIVDLKQSEKTQAEWMLSIALNKLRDEENRLSEIAGALHLQQTALGETVIKQTTVSDVQHIQQYIEFLELRLAEQTQDVEHAKLQVHDRQDQLVVKMRDEKVWQQTRAKAFQQHIRLVQKVEQNQLDEMATMRHDQARDRLI